MKGKGDMETYWLQTIPHDEVKQESESSDDKDVVEGLLVTNL